MGSRISKGGKQKTNTCIVIKGKYCILWKDRVPSRHKLGIILESKGFQNNDQNIPKNKKLDID